MIVTVGIQLAVRNGPLRNLKARVVNRTCSVILMAQEAALSKYFQTPKSETESEAELRFHNHLKEIISALPREDDLYRYGGFWFGERALLGLLSAQKHFEALPATDVFLNTYPKSGTTWIRALAFAVINRGVVPHPLLTTHPQNCAVYLEGLYSRPQLPDLSVDDVDHPRLFSSHVPFSLLPDPVKASGRIVYVSRDPKDVAISMLHYANDVRPPGTPAYAVDDDAFRMFCEGRQQFGPIWAHQMEYRRESLRRPETVLFLQYEEMKAKPEETVRKLAEFLGKPFTQEEEERGGVGEIVRMCSIDFLKELDVNRTGIFRTAGGLTVKNSSFFRKGTVGDWKDHLTPAMAERLDSIVREKTAAI